MPRVRGAAVTSVLSSITAVLIAADPLRQAWIEDINRSVIEVEQEVATRAAITRPPTVEVCPVDPAPAP